MSNKWSPSLPPPSSLTALEDLVRAAQGELPCTLMIKNARLVNVHTAEIQDGTNIGVLNERIVYIGDEELPARSVIEARGKFAIPGLIDTHLHIESSQITPPRFAEAVLPRGTTTVAVDPHEIGNVMGTAGVKLMLDSSENIALKVFVMAPTCVPSVEGLETAGANFSSKEIDEMLGWDRVIGLAEIMDYNGVVSLNEKMIDIVKSGRRHNVTLDGHCMFLSGRPLAAYISTGIEACHENFNPEVALAKLRAGMDYVKIKNVKLMSHVQKESKDAFIRDFVETLAHLPDKRSILFCTDDIFPDNLLEEGHLDHVVRTMIEYGYDPVEAIQGATVSAAAHLRRYELGSIAPGKFADVILMNDLKRFDIDSVFANGQLVARNGRLEALIPSWPFPAVARNTVKLKVPPIEDFLIKAPIRSGKARVNAIDMSTKFTKFVVEEVDVENWTVRPGELTTISVFERHGKSGTKCIALAKNGLSGGAIASTVCHDSHNLIVFGRDNRDMQTAAKTLIDVQGGVVVVDRGVVKACLALPIAGLMSEEPIEVLANSMKNIRAELKKLGRDEPWLLSIWVMGLIVSPSARISDRSLVDVDARKPVPIFFES